MPVPQNPIFFLAYPGIHIHIPNPGMDADQLVMKMQNDIATLEKSSAVSYKNLIIYRAYNTVILLLGI